MTSERDDTKENQNDEIDPLEHAALGETVTVRKSKTLHSINFTPDEYFGSDRFPDHIEIVDVELVDSDGAEAKDIRVTWEGEVTKQLPLHWDYHREPVTAAEKREARRKRWMKRLGGVAPVAIMFGLVGVVSVTVMDELAGSMTIDGEPMVVPSNIEMAAMLGLMFVLALIIQYGVKGGFPGKVYNGR